MRLFKVHETILLYLIPGLYLVISIFVIDDNVPDAAYYRIYEAGLILIVFYLIRELIIAIRINRKDGLRIVPTSISMNILRAISIFVFFAILWMQIDTVLKSVIVFIGPVLNYVLPKPFTEGHFASDKEYFHKSKIFGINEINNLMITDAGDVVFKYKGYEERIVYLSRTNKLKVYEWLTEKCKM